MKGYMVSGKYYYEKNTTQIVAQLMGIIIDKQTNKQGCQKFEVFEKE